MTLITPKRYQLPEIDATDTEEDRAGLLVTDGRRIFSGPMYPVLQRARERSWGELVSAYEFEPEDFYNAYHWVNAHPIFYRWRLPAAYGDLDEDGLPVLVQPEIVYHERHLEHDEGVSQLDIGVLKVDPATGRVEMRTATDGEDEGKEIPDELRNTKTEIWYEVGPWLWPRDAPEHQRGDLPLAGIGQHDWQLDGSADTYEQAIIDVARKLHDRYGNDRTQILW